MSYTEYLTPSERMDAIRIGAAMELADNGISPDEFKSMFKSAAPTTSQVLTGVSTAAKVLSPVSLLNAAIVTGLPLGLLLYAMHRSMKDTDDKSRKMKRELRFYEDAVHELKNNYNVAGRTEGL